MSKNLQVDINELVEIEDNDIIIVRVEQVPNGSIVIEENGSLLVDLETDLRD